MSRVSLQKQPFTHLYWKFPLWCMLDLSRGKRTHTTRARTRNMDKRYAQSTLAPGTHTAHSHLARTQTLGLAVAQQLSLRLTVFSPQPLPSAPSCIPSCGHTLHTACATALVKKCPGDGHFFLACPLCRKETPLTQPQENSIVNLFNTWLLPLRWI